MEYTEVATGPARSSPEHWMDDFGDAVLNSWVMFFSDYTALIICGGHMSKEFDGVDPDVVMFDCPSL